MDEVKKEIQETLKSELKNEGLDIAEETVKSIIKVSFKMLPKLVGLIKNPTAKMLATVAVASLSAVELSALNWADGIDGEKD